MRSGWITSTVVLVVASISAAETLDAPSLTEVVVGSGNSTIIQNAARSYQMFLDDSQFESIAVPVEITGMQFRLAIGEDWRPGGYGGSTWPNVPISFAQYDVQLSRASAALAGNGSYTTLSASFASHQGANVTTVRSGALTIPAGAFLAADSGADGVHAFGAAIAFTTPYLYTPGEDLVLMIRHSGYTGGAAQPLFGSHVLAEGVSDAIRSSSGAAAVNPNSFATGCYMRFTYVTPEPAACCTVLSACALLGRPPRRHREPGDAPAA